MEESAIAVKVNRRIGVYSNIQECIFYDGKTNVPSKAMMDFICEYIDGEFKHLMKLVMACG